jgi:hypothetical protein
MGKPVTRTRGIVGSGALYVEKTGVVFGIYSNAGAPTSGASGTYVNEAGPGSLLVDTTNKKAYINTGTKASPTWTVVGSQS